MGILSAFVLGMFLAPSFGLGRLVIVWMLALGLIVSYLFNVIQLFFKTEPEHSLYHYLILVMGSNVFVSLITATSYAAISDCFLVSFSIMSGFGRIGCYSVGCCYGKRLKTNRIPTQLIESGFHFLNAAFGSIICLAMNVPEGRVAFLLLSNCAVVRFALEFFRDDPRPYFLKLSEAQWISIAILAAFILMVFFI